MKGNAMKKACHKLLNKVTAYMYDNLKPKCPWTMNKNNGTNLLYLVNKVYMCLLQALYKLIYDNKLNVIVLLLKIYV